MESRKSTELLGKSKPHPYRKSGFLSRLFFTWLFPLFYQGFHKDLSEEDLYPSLKQHDATFLGNRLSSEWEKQLQNKNPSLWRALFAVFGCEMAWLALLHLFIELICRQIFGQNMVNLKMILHVATWRMFVKQIGSYLNKLRRTYGQVWRWHHGICAKRCSFD